VEYAAVETLDEAIGLLVEAGDDARAMAGGTDLLAQVHTGSIVPSRVVDLKGIPELSRIDSDAEGYRIGAAVCGAEISEHAALARDWPGVVEAATLIGSTQVQSRASLGGNLCNASPAADSVPALIAAGASCSIVGPGGRRELAVEDVLKGPGETRLERGEIVAYIRLPRPAPGSGDAYLRLIPRSEMDIAIAGAAVALGLDQEGLCSTCRVAIGAVAPTALIVPGAAEVLVGRPVTESALAELADAVRRASDPIDDMRATRDYRIHVVGVLAQRAARLALARADGRERS
jgi:carbon-monoxide dehydrogenase medium subunit